jgi:molybdopterin converting factor small subunit
MATVYLPQNLTVLFPGAPRTVEVEAATVGEAIEALNGRWPGMRSRLLEAGPKLREHINVFVDGEKAGLATAVAPGGAIRVVPSITGG